jgi:hypothetical protein
VTRRARAQAATAERNIPSRQPGCNGERRDPGREERETKDGNAQEVLRERERVAGGIKDVGVEEMERVAKQLVIVPVKHPSAELRVP